MSAIGPIKVSKTLSPTILNTVAVPLTDVFSPEGFVSPGVAKYVNRASGVAIGFPGFTMQVRPPTKESRIYKVTAKLVVPTLEQTSPSTATGIQPAPTKAYDVTAILEFMLPERSTRPEREYLLSYVKSLLAATIAYSDNSNQETTASPVISAVLDFEQPY
jgi:hypothetical protein